MASASLGGHPRVASESEDVPLEIIYSASGIKFCEGDLNDGPFSHIPNDCWEEVHVVLAKIERDMYVLQVLKPKDDAFLVPRPVTVMDNIITPGMLVRHRRGFNEWEVNINVYPQSVDEIWQHLKFATEDNFKIFVQTISYLTTLAIERANLLESRKTTLKTDFFNYFTPSDMLLAQEDALIGIDNMTNTLMDQEIELTAEEVQKGLDDVRALRRFIGLKMQAEAFM